ncbi:hypothetical protein GDO81_005601 [Engystomops pustulosus]|uniref:Uncharacterized protein n=1 Tax=Engystomops pustulosus TaxID=76066 RepID=A0AAV7CT43_ENGPU|nr:hypothetical protein GDO81_005601 [Engystomops pustulosus]
MRSASPGSYILLPDFEGLSSVPKGGSDVVPRVLSKDMEHCQSLAAVLSLTSGCAVTLIPPAEPCCSALLCRHLVVETFMAIFYTLCYYLLLFIFYTFQDKYFFFFSGLGCKYI